MTARMRLTCDHDGCTETLLALPALPPDAFRSVAVRSGWTSEDGRDYCHRPGHRPSDATNRDIHELIDRSSLGTPEAKALRASVSPEQVRRIVRRSHELEYRNALLEHYTAEGVEMVMQSRNTMLDGRSPNDLLDAREWAKLDEWISRLGEGNCS